jgi:hypothetical protein
MNPEPHRASSLGRRADARRCDGSMSAHPALGVAASVAGIKCGAVRRNSSQLCPSSSRSAAAVLVSSCSRCRQFARGLGCVRIRAVAA